jgi:hypothetical protein
MNESKQKAIQKISALMENLFQVSHYPSYDCWIARPIFSKIFMNTAGILCKITMLM